MEIKSKMKIAAGLIVGCAFSFNAIALDNCTTDSLTQSCKVFSEDGPEMIKYPNGTAIPNYVFLNKKAKEAEKQYSKTEKIVESVLDKRMQKFAAIRRDFLMILNTIPDTKISPMQKYWLAEVHGDLGNYLNGSFSNDDDCKQPFPVPLTAREPVMKKMSCREFETILKNALTPIQRKKIIDITKRYAELEGDGEFENIEKHALDLREDWNKITSERKKKVAELVEFSKQSILKTILNGKQFDELSEAEKTSYAKIRDIKYVSGDESSVKSSCSGLITNAYYNPVNHTINICPGFYNFPDSSVLAVIGHEMGHAIDPCNCQFGHHKVNQTKVDELIKWKGLDKDNKTDREVRTFLAQNLEKVEYSAMPFSRYMTSNKVLEQLESKGVLERVSNDVKFSDYPFKGAMNCLINKSNGFLRTEKREDIESKIDRIVEIRKSRQGSSYNAEEDRRDLKAAFFAHPHCGLGTTHSQMGEAMSDWLGSHVLGEYLKDKKLEGIDKLAPVAFFASISCAKMNQTNSQNDNDDKTPMGVVKAALKDLGEADLAVHPYSDTRLDKIYLTNPNVRRALGCSELSSTCYDKEFRAPGLSRGGGLQKTVQPEEVGGQK